MSDCGSAAIDPLPRLFVRSDHSEVKRAREPQRPNDDEEECDDDAVERQQQQQQDEEIRTGEDPVTSAHKTRALLELISYSSSIELSRKPLAC
jgi:hypothetical protein